MYVVLYFEVYGRYWLVVMLNNIS